MFDHPPKRTDEFIDIFDILDEDKDNDKNDDDGKTKAKNDIEKDKRENSNNPELVLGSNNWLSDSHINFAVKKLLNNLKMLISMTQQF